MFFKTRYNILPAVFLLYCMPLLAFGLYRSKSHSEVSWQAFSIGMLLLALGTLAFFLLMRHWENQLNGEVFTDKTKSPHITEEEVEKLQKAYAEAEKRAHEKQAEWQEAHQRYEQLEIEFQAEKQAFKNFKIEKERIQIQYDTLNSELTQFKEFTEEKLEQNQIFLHEHQQTINEQRHVIESKQQHIQQLEDKVRDLTYEIKTLLHLAEKTQVNEDSQLGFMKELFNKPVVEGSSPPPCLDYPINNESEALHQLKRCLDIAQKMTGASHYNRQAKRSEFSIEHYALDLRCLIESLRSEKSFAILLYSQKENKLIFGNPQIKALLGWSADKFIQNFSFIMEESMEIWNNCLAQLAYKNECEAPLTMKSKNGASVCVKCHLGVISTGIFRSNIIGVFYLQPEEVASDYSSQRQ